MEQISTQSTVTEATLNAIDAIYARRSVRRYTARSVSPQLVEDLIGAAIQAPSAMNHQPWSFVVIQESGLLKRICQDAKELLLTSSDWQMASEHASAPLSDPGFDIFYGATTLIVLCAEKGGFQPVGDCYLAAENLMLAATGFGLATCPIGFARDVLGTSCRAFDSCEFRSGVADPCWLCCG